MNTYWTIFLLPALLIVPALISYLHNKHVSEQQALLGLRVPAAMDRRSHRLEGVPQPLREAMLRGDEVWDKVWDDAFGGHDAHLRRSADAGEKDVHDERYW